MGIFLVSNGIVLFYLMCVVYVPSFIHIFYFCLFCYFVHLMFHFSKMQTLCDLGLEKRIYALKISPQKRKNCQKEKGYSIYEILGSCTISPTLTACDLILDSILVLCTSKISIDPKYVISYHSYNPIISL